MLLEIEVKEVKKGEKKEKPILIVNYKEFLEFLFIHLIEKSNSCAFVLHRAFFLSPGVYSLFRRI